MYYKHLFLLFLSLIVTNTWAQSNFIDQPFIDVIGTSEMEITPDEIYIKITLNENDKRGKSIESQEKIMMNALKTINIDVDNCIKVLDIDGYYQRRFLSSNQVVKIKSYELLISNSKNLGDTFRVLDEIEVSRAYVDRISHSEIEKFKHDNKIKAIKIAKTKAYDYCVAVDQELGKVIFIKEQNNTSEYLTNQYYDRNNNYEYITSKGTINNNLSFKKIHLKNSIQVKFSIS